MVAFVGRAAVLRGATQFKDSGIPNLGDTYRGQIFLPSGEVKLAILKDLPIRELANEAFGASLGLTLGLAVPPPFLTLVRDGDMALRHAPPVAEGHVIFASADVSAPSLSQLIVRPNIDHDAALNGIVALLLAGGNVAGLYGFDGWTANVDRHLGNLLIEGSAKAWLIDHGQCFTGPSWSATDLHADSVYPNRLKQWLIPRLTERDKDAVMHEAQRLETRLASLDVRAIGSENAIDNMLSAADFDALVTFLEQRLKHLRLVCADALNRLV